MNKKGQGMSLNVIIISAIVLIVLVILSIIFVGRMRTAPPEDESDPDWDCIEWTTEQGSILSYADAKDLGIDTANFNCTKEINIKTYEMR